MTEYIFKDKTYFSIPKDNPKDRINIEIGDSKIKDTFLPQVKIQRWDNECNISYRLVHNESTPIVSMEGDKIKWKGDKIEAHFYNLIEGDGGYEFEVIFKEKPATNKIEFTLQDKDVEYFYQPAITEVRKPSGDNEAYLDEVLGIILKENPKTILDIGGGIGILAKQLIENGIDVTVLDSSQQAYDERIVDKFILGDIFVELSKMDDNSFDLIINVGLLKYIDKSRADELVSEIKRVSKKSINFEGYGFWAPAPYIFEEPNYDFWKNAFAQDEDAQVYNLIVDTIPFRPENVIGSYAVYAKAPKTNRIGGKEYKCGKIGHIYRPKATDAEGNWTWGELHIENGIITITIPQDFLDKAIYPISSKGLQWGYTGDALSSSTLVVNNWNGSLFTSPADISGETITKISAKSKSSYSVVFKGTIVLHSTLAIVANGVSNVSEATGGTAAFYNATYTNSPSLSNSTDYVLGIVVPYTLYFYFDGGSANQGHEEADNNYTTPTNPTSITHTTNKYAIYITYGGESSDIPLSMTGTGRLNFTGGNKKLIFEVK